jgi:hypothetical protein
MVEHLPSRHEAEFKPPSTDTHTKGENNELLKQMRV